MQFGHLVEIDPEVLQVQGGRLDLKDMRLLVLSAYQEPVNKTFFSDRFGSVKVLIKSNAIGKQ